MSDRALVLIDVQQGFDDPAWGERNNPAAEDRIADLLAAWRERNRRVLHVHHHSTEADSPLRPDGTGVDPKPCGEPLPDEPVFEKSVNGPFVDTDFGAHCRREGIDALALVGFTTDHCVSTTARMAENRGYDVTVVADATATFDRSVPGSDDRLSATESHRAALAHLSGEFASVVETAALL